jgi:GlpG protein
MRPIGRLQDENQARRFGDFLSVKGIENQVDPDLHGTWEIWVLDDANIETAKQALDEFTQKPDDPRFVETSRAADRKRKQDQQTQVGKRVRMIDGRTIFYSPPVPVGILTIILIVISVAVTLLTDFGKKNQYVQPFSITQYQVKGIYVHYGEPGLPEVRHGQIWRLFTPMFLHFNFLHIFFNMLWLRDLGSMIEARKSSWMLLLLLLVIAGTSNFAQYLVSGPVFGGMSGVVYGLLGYIWMQGRFDPASKLSLEPQTVLFMIVWFFLCLFGLVGNIANTVHAVGLVVGIVWGFLAARLSVATRRR